MPRQATILKVFVASPNDVMEERGILEQVVRELNVTWSKTLGVYLELVKWETHAFPGISTDSQAVINDQIADDYEIFIGMLSTKFGTQTGRAESGTAEEFGRAYERFRANPDQLRIMVYFKDAELKPSELDIDQYRLVKDFQQKLGEKGTLYWSFTSADDFVALVRMHLSRQVQEWGRTWGTSGTLVPHEIALHKASQAALAVDEPEDAGFLDLIESGQENLETMNGAISRMSEALQELTKRLQDNTPEFQQAAAQGDMKRAKRTANSIASSMEEYADRIEGELPIFSRSYSVGMDSIARAASLLTTDFQGDNKEHIQTVYSQIQTLAAATTEARSSTREFRDTVATLPRLTTAFNKAKKRNIKVIDELVEEITGAINLTSETEKELKRILEGSA
jgi:prefoldin subunit 5